MCDLLLARAERGLGAGWAPAGRRLGAGWARHHAYAALKGKVTVPPYAASKHIVLSRVLLTRLNSPAFRCGTEEFLIPA